MCVYKVTLLCHIDLKCVNFDPVIVVILPMFAMYSLQ